MPSATSDSDPARIVAVAASIRRAAGTRSPHERRSGIASGLTTAHVEDALREWWSIGRDAFMTKYGGSPAERYAIATELGDVDALALLLGARALAGMDATGSWRGDRDNVAQPLRELGFRVEDSGRQSPPPVRAAPQTLQPAAGRSRDAAGRGQGFMLDQYTKLAVETYAMNLAREHYAALGTVVDTALRRSWDYEVTIDDTCWHVEVKGTTGDPREVLLTPNEVAHARTYPFVALFVVSNVTVQPAEHDERIISGGTTTVFHPWSIDDGQLQPLAFRYCLPTGPADLHRSNS